MTRSIQYLIVFLFLGITCNAKTVPIQDTAIAPESVSGEEQFVNLMAESGEESATLFWSLDHSVYTNYKNSQAKIIVRYKIDKIRGADVDQGNEWHYSELLELNESNLTIDNLAGNANYIFNVGIAPRGTPELDKDRISWSADITVRTARSWGIIKLLILIGSLGLFIYGMKIMSEGIQQVAGGWLRKILEGMTSSRLNSVLTGFGITSIVQSSSITTVMTVSQVNTGVLTLRQSAGVMMGANIGTTVTTWLILLLAFKFDFPSYAFILIAIGTPLLFLQKSRLRAWASTIFGFAILFLGIEVLKVAVPTLNDSSIITEFFFNFKDVWYGSVLFVIIGALLTIIIQSSSATMVLTLALVSAGTLPFELGCAMVLGENIGSTITAEIASLVANVHAKRAARIHSMFNIIGVIWSLIIFSWFLKLTGFIVGGNEFDPTNTAMASTGIALFHTLFNLANVLILIWFIPELVKLATRSIKSKGEIDEEFKLDYISGPLGSTAELCVLEAKKEVAKFGKITAKMNKFTQTYLNSSDKKEKNKMLRKIEKYEEATDRIEVEIANYLGSVSRLEMSDAASFRMRGMINITTDLERIGDIFYQMSKTMERKDESKIYFTPEQRNGLNEMLKIVGEAFEIMNDNLNAEYGSIAIDKAVNKEHEINQKRNELRELHHEQLGDKNNLKNALIFNDVFSSLEKIGDHIINVSEHVAGINLE